MKFLSESGLTYFLNKLKGLFITKTDFNKVYDNGVVDAKQIVHKTNSGSSTNYDLVLGNKTDDNNDSYIKIDSTRTVNSNGKYKNGDMTISSNGNLSVSSYNAIHFNHNNKNSLTIGDGILLSPNTNTTIASQLFVESDFNKLSLTDNVFDVSFKNSTDSDKTIHFERKGFNSNDSDKLQFLVNSNVAVLDIRPTQIKCWTDAFSIKKDKEIKFKTSSENNIRLTEGQGFKVFANMYAMPDNATDISEYTDEEKQLLANNTVQKLLLKLNSSKAAAKVVKKIAKQTIHEPQVCIRKAISLGSAGQGVKYFHKNTPAIKFKLSASDVAYYKLMDTDGNVLELDITRNGYANSVGNGVYKVDKVLLPWRNMFIINKIYDAPMFTEVMSVAKETIDGLTVNIVTLRFTDASTFTGKTTSPCINIMKGEPCGTTCPNRLPFETNSQVDNIITNYRCFNKTIDKNAIQIFINKRCKCERNSNIIGYKRRLYLGNTNNKDYAHTALIKYSGIAMLVYYRKNIRIGTRNIYITRQGYFRA